MTATVPLKRIAAIRVSSVDKLSVEGQTTVRLCNYTDVYYRDEIRSAQEFMAATATPDQIAAFRLRPGDIVITKDSETAADIAVPAFVADAALDLVCGYHLAIVRPETSSVVPRFLYWAMSSGSVRNQFAVAATGVTRFGLRSSDIGKATITLPTIPEQQAIVDFLDVETTRIDEIVDRRKQVIGLGLEHMHALRSRIGWVAADETIPLMYLTQRGRPIMYGIVLPGPDVDKGVPIVKGGDVVAGLSRQLCKTTHKIESGYARSRLREGDLVFAIRGGVGDVAAVPSSAAGANITQDVARVAPAANVNASWLLHVLQGAQFQAQALSRVTGATIRGLNIRDLKRLHVPRVSVEEQRSRANALDAAAARLRGLNSRHARQIALLQEHRQALITAAVTGQIDVTRAVA